MLPRRHRKRTVWRGLSLLFAVLTATVALTGATATAQSSPDDPLVRQGQDIYGRSCATCHGDGGVGQDTVPSIVDAGAASVDFYLSTGRMPMERIGDKLERGPQLVTDAEKRALIAYVSSLGDGPPIPEIDDYRDADIARGLELFTSNCAACHGPTAAGIAVGQRDVSSNLDVATPLEIAEAIRVGPGVMPVFGNDVIDDEDLGAIVAWVLDLRQRAAPGGAQIGRSGPVSEGFVAWVVGLGLLTIVMYLLGEQAKDEDDV